MSDAKPIPVWLDTDPGVDDAMAMGLLFAIPEYDVKGVSAVAGNVALKKPSKMPGIWPLSLAAGTCRCTRAHRILWCARLGRPPSSTGRTASGT